MEQNKRRMEAPAQPTLDPTRNKEVHQTPERNLRSEKIQTNFQQPQGFSNAQLTQEGELAPPQEGNPNQTGHKHNRSGPLERLHPQHQMPIEDKHQPRGNAAFTHKISQDTNGSSSEDKQPTPRQNRDNGYPASSRDNPLTARRWDSSDDDYKPDPLYDLSVMKRDSRSSPRSSNLPKFTVDEANNMSQEYDSYNNNSTNETPYIQTSVPSEGSQTKKYPTATAVNIPTRWFPTYRDAPTDNDSATPKQSTMSEHRSVTEGHTNNNHTVYHNRCDHPGHQAKMYGGQPINLTTDIQSHQRYKYQDGNQPKGAQSIDKANNIRGTEKISEIKDS